MHRIHLLSFLAMIPSLAQQPKVEPVKSWENLRVLRPGDKIQVVQKDMKSWSGPFAGLSDESISLRTNQGDKIIDRSAVFRVSRHGGRRARHALIGAALLGGVGVAAGVATGGCDGSSLGPCVSRGVLGAAVGGAGAVVGAAVGASIPGSIVVYRAP